MRIYLSGLNSIPRPVREFILDPKQRGMNILMSYLHFTHRNPVQLREEWSNWTVFVDSGGFSVRVYGEQIPVEPYRDFLLGLKNCYHTCANLDGLQFDFGWRNQKILEAAGLRPIPVYHVNDWQDSRTRHVLKAWVKDYPYIACSAFLPRKSEEGYLDYVFSIAGTKTKMHGFAGTTPEILEKYPFYSVDSTSWKTSDRFGWYYEFRGGQLIAHKGLTKTKKLHHGNLLSTPERMIRSLKAWMKYEQHLTDMWAHRGVVWEE